MQIKVYIYICILIHSSCYVLNFMLPAQPKRLGRPGLEYSISMCKVTEMDPCERGY
jgi:hypothetical protein